MAKSVTPAELLYSDSEHHADQMYLGRFLMGDPYIAVRKGSTRITVLNQLEYARGVKESSYDVIVALEDLADAIRKRKKGTVITPALLIAELAKVYGIKAFVVPTDFPAGLLLSLRALGIKVDVREGVFFPARETKSAEEIAALEEGNRVSALGIAAGAAMLAASRIRAGKLMLRGREITSEWLREEIAIACLRAGGNASHTIVAGGDQACDPHCRGTGPIRPNELVIFDVFPRMQKGGYWGDMTRTFLKGRASDAQRKLVAAVAEAQKAAIARIKAGVTGKRVHEEVVATFKRHGYETTREGGVPKGFIHGTGHGLGLDIHESPRMNPTGPKLRAGMVVTVEPGLYYPGLGGARIEDVVVVTKEGSRMISQAPYEWEIA